MAERILITGAAGRIGAALRTRLARPGRTLRLLDIAPVPEPEPGEAVEVVQASAADLDAVREASRDVTAVVHLAAFSGEDRWERILHTNIQSSYAVLEAARLEGVPRVVYASSNHAVGFHPRNGGTAPDYVYPRPDTYYGVSKVTGEALGSLYHDRYGLHVVCLRIGTCTDEPPSERALATWLSYDDCGRLVEAALTAPDPGFRVVWGISANTRAWWSLDEAAALGYRPQDDAEAYADRVRPESNEVSLRLVGGDFCSPRLDADNL